MLYQLSYASLNPWFRRSKFLRPHRHRTPRRNGDKDSMIAK